jgi:hypothetical protein
MEPVFMVLGQSSATAAALAIDDKVSLQELDYAKLKRRLESDGQTLDFESPVAQGSISKQQLGGIVVDDTEAKLTGFSAEGHSVPGFVGEGYRHDGNAGKGEQTARFIPDLKTAGKYQVGIVYSPHANRASNVPVIIHHANGETKVIVNQRRAPASSNSLQPLGEFRFEAGKSGWVEIRNDGTDGHVIVDAVRFQPEK